ncbi:hypothetical protein Tco_1248919 [Tanacetum coccineum]
MQNSPFMEESVKLEEIMNAKVVVVRVEVVLAMVGEVVTWLEEIFSGRNQECVCGEWLGEKKNVCGEVNRGGDDFGVSKSLLGEIPSVVIDESGGETFGDDRGAIW